MADSQIAVTEGSGKNVDTRTNASGDHRQVIVIGNPTATDSVAEVQATDPSSNALGLVVRDVNGSAIVAKLNSGVSVTQSGTFAVYFDQSAPTVKAIPSTGTFTVGFDPGHTLGKVDAGLGTFNVQFDPGHTLGTVLVNPGTGTLNVQFDPGHTLGTVTANAGTGTMTVKFDPGATLGKVDAGIGTFTIKTDPGYTLGSIQNINTTVTVKFDPGNTLGKVDQGVASTTQPWLVNSQSTASVFTASGSVSGVSVSGNTIISPSAAASFKIYAFSIQTTGQVSLTTKFTNGSGGSPTEFFRPLITASGVTGAQGANLSTGGPGNPLFVTGTSTTLSLVLDSATLVHYSVSYTKESA